MASATHVQTSTLASDSGDGFQWLGGDFAPRDEARGLFVLIRRKADSVEAVRELIAVPPEIEDALRLYASHHPEDAQGIEKVLKFRKRVREEFDRLVREREDADMSSSPDGGRCDRALINEVGSASAGYCSPTRIQDNRSRCTGGLNCGSARSIQVNTRPRETMRYRFPQFSSS